MVSLILPLYDSACLRDTAHLFTHQDKRVQGMKMSDLVPTSMLKGCIVRAGRFLQFNLGFFGTKTFWKKLWDLLRRWPQNLGNLHIGWMRPSILPALRGTFPGNLCAGCRVFPAFLSAAGL